MQVTYISHNFLFRLVRVCQSYNKVKSTNGLPSAGTFIDQICLFEDYVALQCEEMIILRIQRIRKKGATRSYVEYKLPVSYSSPDRRDILILGQIYTERDGGFELQGSPIEIRASEVIFWKNKLKTISKRRNHVWPFTAHKEDLWCRVHAPSSKPMLGSTKRSRHLQH